MEASFDERCRKVAEELEGHADYVRAYLHGDPDEVGAVQTQQKASDVLESVASWFEFAAKRLRGEEPLR